MNTIRTHIQFILAIIFLTTLSISCSPEKGDSGETLENGNRKSPIAIASVKGEATYIKVVYGQPYRRGREVFGELEPYGEVWRTGANEATEITFTKQVLFGGEAVQAGTYTLFTIPEKDSFTVILNHELGQWGAFEYNEERDYKRIKVPVKELKTPIEAFSIQFTKPEFSMTTMSLKWDRVQVDIPIRLYGE